MLIFAEKMNAFSFSKLMDVYEEGNRDNGVLRYAHLSESQQLLCAENDFYQYLSEVFFRERDAIYSIWEERERYISALRLEPYCDGMLLSALETRPDARGKGYATKLVKAVIDTLRMSGSGRVYSHVSKSNSQSLSVHLKNNFEIVKDYAVYLDGSVAQNCYTLRLEY